MNFLKALYMRRNTGLPRLLLHVRQKLLTLLVENPIFTVNWRHWRDHVKIKNSILNKFYKDLTFAKEIQSIEKEENKRGVPVMKFKKRVLTVTHWVLQSWKRRLGRTFHGTQSSTANLSCLRFRKRKGFIHVYSMPQPQVYSKPSHPSNLEFFATIANGF